MSHDIQIDPATFNAIANGQRSLDVVNRNYGVADVVCLREYHADTPLPAR
jgi:hypothetical protein